MSLLRPKKYTCPDCEAPLLQLPKRNRFLYICPNKHGRMAMLSVLRQWFRKDAKEAFEKIARSPGRTAGKRKCPVCTEPLLVARYGGMNLDFCDDCHLFWFDQGELERIPEDPKDPSDRFSLEMDSGVNPRVFGGGTEFENLVGETRSAPGASMFLIFLFTAISYIAWKSGFQLDWFVFDPKNPLHKGGVPAFLSLFVHMDVFHFLGNVGLFRGVSYTAHLGGVVTAVVLHLAGFFSPPMPKAQKGVTSVYKTQ